MLPRNTHRPRTMLETQPVPFVQLSYPVGIRYEKNVHANPRCPSPRIAPHERCLQRVSGINLEVRRAVIGSAGWCSELCELPIFVQRLDSHTESEVHETKRRERLSHASFARASQLVMIGLVHYPHGWTQNVDALVWAVHRAVTMMVKIHAGTHPPRSVEVVGGMRTRAKIDKPSRADKLVVYGIIGVIFLFGIPHPRCQRIVYLPMGCSKDGTFKHSVDSHGISQPRGIIHRLQQSPCRILLTSHRHTVV